MSVKTSIFGSRSEADGFRSIENTWGEQYRLIPQFQWSALFDPDPSWRGTSNLFFKTSVDYLLSTIDGQPLLAIDFDGMGGGYDRNGQYVPKRITEDPNRKTKFDFKLRWARANDFPYHIVASREFEQLGDGTDLTVVDAIIGTIIARKHFRERLQFLTQEHASEIESQPSWYRHEYIQDLVTDLETQCDIEHNPVVRKTLEVWSQIAEITGGGYFGCSHRPISEPELPADFKSRLDAIKTVDSWGCIASISETPVGEVSAMAMVRNNTCHISVYDIAELLAYSKLLRLIRRTGK